MNERVNYDCRPGDVICFRDDEGWTRNATVRATWSRGCAVQFSDDEVQAFSYETLYERKATYVAKLEVVARPEHCPISGW